jgi:glycosyltransferase involved in cell wall biosynthesis
MKILHLTLSAALGGRRDAIMTLVDHLRPLGIECGVVALRDSASGIATLANRADYVDGLAIRARPTWDELKQVRQICLRRGVNLVHAHDHGSQYVASALRFLSPSLRAVMTFHRTLGIETEGRRNRIRNALTLPLIQRVLTASEERRKYFIDSTLVQKNKVMVIPIGVDLDRFRPNRAERGAIRERLGLDPDVTLALAIGHFGTEKGIDQVLTAAAHARPLLGEQPWHLAVLGTGSADRVALMQATGQQLLPGRVSWVGFQADVTPWIQAADLLIHAPRREAFGMVVVQAMACGLPVAALAVGGVPELVVHEQTGLLAPAGDLDGLGAAVARMISDPALRNAMGERALGRAMQYYDARECARRHASLYRELIPATRSAAP